MSIILPEGATLSRLCHAALKFLKPKKRDRLGEAEPRLCMSENDACDWARSSVCGRSPPAVSVLLGLGENERE